jgi:uncharacterized protein YdiU (UPF0061 family)
MALATLISMLIDAPFSEPAKHDVGLNRCSRVIGISWAQSNTSVYALRALLNSLAPIIGAEANLEGKAVPAGWAEGTSQEQVAEWQQKGVSLVKDEMEHLIRDVTAQEYGRLMRKVSLRWHRFLALSPSPLRSTHTKRLALRSVDEADETKIFQPLLTIMQDHKLDYHSTFRKLCFFRPSFMQSSVNGGTSDEPQPSSSLEKFIGELLATCPGPVDYAKATSDWMTWLDTYAQRIVSEGAEWSGDMDAEREKAAKLANPRFVLRQWLLEEVIENVEKDYDSGKKLLAKVLHVGAPLFLARPISV